MCSFLTLCISLDLRERKNLDPMRLNFHFNYFSYYRTNYCQIFIIWQFIMFSQDFKYMLIYDRCCSGAFQTHYHLSRVSYKSYKCEFIFLTFKQCSSQTGWLCSFVLYHTLQQIPIIKKKLNLTLMFLSNMTVIYLAFAKNYFFWAKSDFFPKCR